MTDDGITHEFMTSGAENTHCGGVIALTKNNEVITTYQFRPGPERWMYDLPGGSIEPGEDYMVGAFRELQEETGYVPGDITHIGDSSRSGYANEQWHYYLARGCELSPSGKHMDDLEIAQGAEVRLISISDLIDNAKSDAMNDPVAVLLAYDTLKLIEKRGD